MINALIGGTFAYWGLRWKTTVDGKKIRVRPAFSAAKELPFTEIKKAVLHKKKKNGSLMYYTLIDSKGQEIVKLYPTMKDSAMLLERLKRLKVRIEEVNDR